jgi:NAD-dependent deacetylase
LWKQFRPEELASQDGFARHPDVVWEWYRWRRAKCRAAEPNAGHEAIASLSQLVPAVTVVTQNVDGLHQRAGSTDVIELHGNIHRDKCNSCGRVADEPAPEEGLPECACGGLLRPDVVWFGEALPASAFERAVSESSSASVFITVGTAGVVYPAAALPQEAARSGAFTAEFNVERTAITGVHDLHVPGPADERLADAISLLRG